MPKINQSQEEYQEYWAEIERQRAAAMVGHVPCQYVIRRAGETWDGKPLPGGVGYGGDTSDVCGKPGNEELHNGGRDVVARCPAHAGL